MPRWVWCCVWLCLGSSLQAQVVPGTGTLLPQVSDDFEDPDWTFHLNLPKASSNLDKIDRQPAGYSTNGKWYESTYRGTPDVVKRVEPPLGGIPGSTGALALRTLYSGVPGQLSYKYQQDDLLANFANTIGYLPVSRVPSVVVRVYLPPFDQWEPRTGSHFGFRVDCQTVISKSSNTPRLFRTASNSRKIENYWPGMFVQFFSRADGETQQDHAMIVIRAGNRGEDLAGPQIQQPGWWTLGMSFTPDGQVHYYARPGVERLTPRDHLVSTFPYGYNALQVNTYFFNIVNQDDGRTWSTEFIIDDPEVYVLH
ncbi:MAG: hypothetical protein KatS3mg114_0628 [Planctomycetaceae bacterium]|nr:MAG: hypothetical protein KatS3mg114_0628 [Planctomycetaceae bacterium]